MAEETKTETQFIEDRIYIGNVDFRATEEEVKELFKDLSVTDVEIPFKETTRGDSTFKRHLGFAFVQFESKEDADKAIADFNGSKFQRRNIFIKKAVPPPTEEQKKERAEAYRAKREEYLKEQAERRAEAQKRKEERAAAGEDVEKTPEGKPSTDTIFITNLDYKVTHKGLSSYFKELKPKWVHVPLRKSHNHNSHRRPFNRGIAFVKFLDEETQKKAVEEFNGKEINGREIIVDIAIDARVPKEGEVDEHQNREESPAEENQDENGN
ncbi:Single-stranded TG1-3 DNA-binding protein [Spathaspora sp. JA1]|nr:Single-stranded TG1-3 DNA-binding protein [Spathaspora sp. JA1]